MLKSIASPLFLFLAFIMILSSSIEFGPNQWIPTLFQNFNPDMFGEGSFGSILILVWISLVIAFARLIAAPIVRKVSSLGVLVVSSILSTIGIYMMSIYTDGVIFVAATIFALGIAYFWPNMLGLVAERRPLTGALGLAIMGGAGTLGGAIIQPVIGAIYDVEKLSHPTDLAAGAATLQYIAIIPACLIVVFGLMFINQLKKTKTV